MIEDFNGFFLASEQKLLDEQKDLENDLAQCEAEMVERKEFERQNAIEAREERENELLNLLNEKEALMQQKKNTQMALLECRSVVARTAVAKPGENIADGAQ